METLFCINPSPFPHTIINTPSTCQLLEDKYQFNKLIKSVSADQGEKRKKTEKGNILN